MDKQKQIADMSDDAIREMIKTLVLEAEKESDALFDVVENQAAESC